MAQEGEGKQLLGLYVHIPFCVRKCEYCDFLSMQAGVKQQEQYIEALLWEIEAQSSIAENMLVDSIFIGGGTPSILKAEQIERIMKRIRKHYALKAGVEITIECNPGTLDEEKLRSYQRAGINRISLGLQSANNEELRLLGRIHTFEQFEHSAVLVKKYFHNWNVDLMSALPGQSVESYRTTLERVRNLHPTHISAYSLMIEEGTPFYEKYKEDYRLRERGETPRLLPDEETERKMYELTQQVLEREGYYRYEISNYAREGFESRHNNRYWLRQEYLGLGLGASSCMQNVRWHNVTDLKEYVQQAVRSSNQLYEDMQKSDAAVCFKREEEQQLTRQEQMEETMFLGLRRMQGVDKEAFARQFGQRVEEIYGEVLERLEQEELLQYSGKYIQLTQLGIDVSNYVLAQFLFV